MSWHVAPISPFMQELLGAEITAPAVGSSEQGPAISSRAEAETAAAAHSPRQPAAEPQPSPAEPSLSNGALDRKPSCQARPLAGDSLAAAGSSDDGFGAFGEAEPTPESPTAILPAAASEEPSAGSPASGDLPQRLSSGGFGAFDKASESAQPAAELASREPQPAGHADKAVASAQPPAEPVSREPEPAGGRAASAAGSDAGFGAFDEAPEAAGPAPVAAPAQPGRTVSAASDADNGFGAFDTPAASAEHAAGSAPAAAASADSAASAASSSDSGFGDFDTPAASAEPAAGSSPAAAASADRADSAAGSSDSGFGDFDDADSAPQPAAAQEPAAAAPSTAAVPASSQPSAEQRDALSLPTQAFLQVGWCCPTISSKTGCCYSLPCCIVPACGARAIFPPERAAAADHSCVRAAGTASAGPAHSATPVSRPAGPGTSLPRIGGSCTGFLASRPPAS